MIVVVVVVVRIALMKSYYGTLSEYKTYFTVAQYPSQGTWDI